MEKKLAGAQLPLTKTLDPDDYLALAPWLAEVDAVGVGEQHTHRRWEYAQALRAWDTSGRTPVRGIPTTQRAYDVGGAGSPFYKMMATRATTFVIDPKINSGIELSHEPRAAAVFAISTIEHVKDEEAFVQALDAHLLPGGMLFLTMDCWNQGDIDEAHFWWMRERIYTMTSWPLLGLALSNMGYEGLGLVDWNYRGDQVYNYSFASLAMQKGRR